MRQYLCAGGRVTISSPPSLLVLLSLLLTACTPIRPVAKLGLIAPFEGLYRRSGYEALAAVRAAVADFPVAGIEVLPVALDDSGAPELAARATAKLRVDPAVAAVVGPLAPESTTAIAPPGSDSVPWLLPYAPGDTVREGAWALGLVQQAAQMAAGQGATGLVLAGWAPPWPDLTPAAWAEVAGLPVRRSDDPAQVRTEEAVFWMGNPADGAAYLAALRRLNPQARFWTGPQAGDPVFAEHAQPFAPIHWVIWSDEGYNAWSTAHTPSSPTAYLVYRAATAALAVIDGSVPAGAEGWFVQAYELRPDGSSARYAPVP